ncbi:MAG TPA: XdhC/CoxI family protein [Rectinemataceae bacterium]|nr:XdhC/CoxI family protein [Rectinemataceae bacterium]
MERKLLTAISEELGAGRSLALITVIETKGSAPRHVGSSMLLLQDGSIRGTVGGGSGEAEAMEAARRCMQGRKALVLEVDKLGKDVAGPEGICGGVTRMLVEAIDGSSALVPQLNEAAAGRRASLLRTIPGGGEFEDPLVEADRLIIFGGGHVGLALARLASELDFAVTVCDERPEFAHPDRFPSGVSTLAGAYLDSIARLEIGRGDWAVVMTPDHQHDHLCVRELFRRAPRYLGFIGSARKTRLILEALKAEGGDPATVDAIRAPIGLDIGAETPAEIAVSILAELVAERRGAKLLEGLAADRARRRT